MGIGIFRHRVARVFFSALLFVWGGAAFAGALKTSQTFDCLVSSISSGELSFPYLWEQHEALSKSDDLAIDFAAAVKKQIQSDEGLSNHRERSAAQELIRFLNQDQKNEHVLHQVFETITDDLKSPRGDTFFSPQIDLLTLLDPLSQRPEFLADTQRLSEVLLERAKVEGGDASWMRDFLGKHFDRLMDEKLKKKIVDHFLTYLERENRFTLQKFAKQVSAPELEHLPIALATFHNLEKLKTQTRSLDYAEWSKFGWMENSTAIPTYDQTFQQAASRASQIHFEVGNIVNEMDYLKNAFSKIRELGSKDALREIGDKFESSTEEYGPPKLTQGAVSITNLELFWLLNDPEFLKKTTFYVDFRPLTKAEKDKLVRELKKL